MDSDRIVMYLEKLSVDRVKVDRRNVWIPCPFSSRHRGGIDRRPSCSIKIEDDGVSPFICWTCRTSGTFTKLVQVVSLKADNRYRDVVAAVAREEEPNLDAEIARSATPYEEGGLPVVTGPQVKTEAARIFSNKELRPFVGSVPQYILDRGISTDTCRDWNLGFDESRRDPRLIFPIRDFEKNLVGLVGRTLADSHIKYRNYWGFRAEIYLYGEDKVDSASNLPLLLVEGPVDVLWVWQNRVAQPLGLLGSALTPSKAAKVQMFAGGRPVLTLFDDDTAGDAARRSAEKLLSGRVPLFHYYPSEGKDPAEMSPTELAACLELEEGPPGFVSAG